MSIVDSVLGVLFLELGRTDEMAAFVLVLVDPRLVEGTVLNWSVDECPVGLTYFLVLLEFKELIIYPTLFTLVRPRYSARLSMLFLIRLV